MKTQAEINYERIAEAITYLQQHFTTHPNLDEIAEKIHLSPFHFQKLFTEWVGISPKKFLQYLSVKHAKTLLREYQQSLSETTYELGLSSTSRLHDWFVSIEGMSPATYKHGGKDLNISYNYMDSPFGKLGIGSTEKGVCYLAFITHEDEASTGIQEIFPQAQLTLAPIPQTASIQALLTQDWENVHPIAVHLKATPFQLKVWEALLKIPVGYLTNYQTLAQQLGNKQAARAVGTAIGSNPIAFLIPCHRVIQNSGMIGGYRWGNTRKTAIIAWESAQRNKIEIVE